MTTRSQPLRGRARLLGLGVALASLVSLVGLVGVARAADAGASTSGGSISPEYLAPRFMPYSDASAPPHLNDFSPLAINYADCINEIDLELTLDLSDIPGGAEIQAWAGTGTADCTQVSARTATSDSTPDSFPGRCWPVAPPGTFDPSHNPSTARLHVLDLVSHIGDPNPPTTYSATTSTSVCKPNATYSAVPLNIYFFFAPTGSGRGSIAAAIPVGIPGLYQTPAALVGPFAPTGVSVPNSGITSTSLTVSWSPQAESIIQGYNVYYEDQGPGGIRAGKVGVDSGASVYYGVECHPVKGCSADAGARTKDAAADAKKDSTADKDAGVRDATVDATKDATVAADAGDDDGGEGDAGEADAGSVVTCDAGFLDAWVQEDAAAFAGETAEQLAAAGCELTGPFNKITTNGNASLTCNSNTLIDEFTIDGGTGGAAVDDDDAGTSGVLTTTVSTDGGTDAGTTTAVDSGTISLSGSTTVQETAGISYIAGSHLAYYATGATANSYTIDNLRTGDQYAIGVAAVDSYGNVGPLGAVLSPTTGNPTGGIVACSTPTPVDDFFTQYGLDGGKAGGGYCALTAVGAPAPFFASIFGAGLVAAALGRGRRRRRQSTP